MSELPSESVFTWSATPLKFGAGAVDEIGHDVTRLGVRRVLVLTDRQVAATGLAERVVDGLRASGADRCASRPTPACAPP
jgi:alcohol dehydrogenase class IV